MSGSSAGNWLSLQLGLGSSLKHEKQGTPSFSASLPKSFSGPGITEGNYRRSGTEPLGTGAELGRACVRISFPFTLLPSCLAMISSLALKEIQPKALKNLCCRKQPFIIFPFI